MESHKFVQLLLTCGLFVLCAGTACSNSLSKAYTGPTTAAGLNLIKEHEGFQPYFYTDSKKNKLIGYGYVCQANLCDKLRPPITVSQATSLLKAQLKSFEECVNANVRCGQLNAAQFSALVSFTFDLGCECLKKSALLLKLNKNDVSGASAEFAKWNRKDGKVTPELTRRRAAERQLFCSKNAC
ncbi:uncharacterized protein LOC119070744 [Bradysia coprophila]|uniref:uncharacterized protein LOC119070744 n=1 Tax=Bradysia coprophila TaxID=38358 RepID=UPI00187D9197|nr:uncharacterized protein LOC119070744 [Bradysia coprophila]